MRLRTFLISLFLISLFVTAVANYSIYYGTRQIVFSFISDWSSSALLQSDHALAGYLSQAQMAPIQKVLDKGIATRPFIACLSVSFDGRHYSQSSNRSLEGKLIEDEFYFVQGPLAEAVFSGTTRFKFPINYYHNGQSRTAYLLLTLDAHYVHGRVWAHAVNTTLRVLLVTAVILGLALLYFYRFLITPLDDVLHYVTTGQGVERSYFITDFTFLSARVRQSFAMLRQQKEQLQRTLASECHLEQILQTVADINKLLVVCHDDEELLQKSCDRLAAHGDYRLAWIGLVKQARIEVVVHSEDPTDFLGDGFGLSLEASDPTSQGPAAQSILQGRSIVLNDFEREESFKRWRPRATAAGFKAEMALPLRKDDYSTPFGVLVLFTDNAEGFVPREVEMLEELAGDIGFACHAFRRERQLRQFLSTEQLTRLPNRSALLETLTHYDESQVIVLNINDFKEVNEVYGFRVGDALIRTFATALQQLIAGHQGLVLYSLGGDSFALLVRPGHPKPLASFIEQLVTDLENNTYQCEGILVSPLITAGYASSNELVVEKAELALKRAREDKQKVGHFDPSLLLVEQHQQNMLWYNVVREAIADGRIVPYFQGIVDNRSGQIVKYETLMRLKTADGKLAMPGQFLNIAKKTRLYPELTVMMVEKAVGFFQDLSLPLSINLSREDMLNEQVIATLRQTIARSGMGERLIFEILESEGIENYDKVSSFIEEFKALGCRIAIDDFGSGYSNFEHLLNLNIDFLKIDSSLIQNIVHDRHAQILVRHIHSLAKDLNMQTIAEFVSSRDVYETVKQIGIDFSQGYHFHQPAPFDALPCNAATVAPSAN
ncbi:MAG: EAL domain-containing protein [Desulfuromonadaceae bacterium]|nr:EAL domain-containing protein [Desulfuromonadaceae bacterium]